jgi:hypothetical protein
MTRAPLRIALLADGRSDRALLHVIRWVLRAADPEVVLAQSGFRPRDMAADFAAEIKAMVELHAPAILFVHRDAEAQDPELRWREIPDTAQAALVRVVPVRMTEAWLLFDELAIRTAVGRPSRRARLYLPPLQRVESLPDPKGLLRDLLLAAAEATGRRRKRLLQDHGNVVQRVAELIRDFAPLRVLPAFARFEHDCRETLARLR